MYLLLIMAGRSFLSKGSPPVMRILSTPCLTNSFAMRTTSGVESSFWDGVNGTPSSGIQYVPIVSNIFYRHK